MATQTPELTRLMDNARVHLPGALDAALKLELFNVLDQFLQDTKFWQEDIDYVTRSGRTEYVLVGTEQGVITDLLNNVNANGSPVRASMPTLGTLVLGRDPTPSETLTATVAYTVVDPVGSDDYPQIPDELLYKYGRGITDGVVGAMMLQAAKPYTNQQLAVYHTRKFNGAIAQARADVAHRNVQGGQNWRYPAFAHGSQR
jgi:hypothetical protein